MVKYPEDLDFSVPSITGAQVSAPGQLIPSQPGSFPAAPKQFDAVFHSTLERIFREAMLDELRNVRRDIQTANPGDNPMVKRGHVVAVAYMCALDAVSSYGYKNRNVRKFVRNHFPDEYKRYASRIYPDYRLNLVHAWNLFGPASLVPGNQPISEQNGIISFGILHFADAFEKAVLDFLAKLKTDKQLQERSLFRYRELTGEIKASKSDNTLVAGAVGFGKLSSVPDT